MFFEMHEGRKTGGEPRYFRYWESLLRGGPQLRIPLLFVNSNEERQGKDRLL